MPVVVRGSHAGLEHTATSPSSERPHFELERQSSKDDATLPTDHHDRRSHTFSHPFSSTDEQAVASPSPHRHVAFRADSKEPPSSPLPRQSINPNRRRSSSFFRTDSEPRPEADAYYDSRAATKREWKRRATTLQDYYHDNPDLLPQLPFTWHRGKKRFRLIFFIILIWIDACIVPIALYYALTYGGNIQGWITFAVVTTVWGGPTYLEFGVRTFKLMKKERFYRPLGTNSRWCFDYLNWVSTATIFVITTLFIVGSAPHVVWLRVLCMPMPAMLYCLGILTGWPTLYHKMGWKAPFRLSSTAKGEIPKPAVYYFMEDTVAVNANAGRPYREALASRYEVSPRFRRMLYVQSVFWSIPAIVIAIPLTIIAVIHSVPATVAYAICWAIPFIWATVWGLISLVWCKRALEAERTEWETSRTPLTTKELAIDTERSSPAPPQDERKEDHETTPEQAV